MIGDGDLLRAIQGRTARIAVGPSGTRGQGAPGIVACARLYFAELDLSQFGISRATSFRARLDSGTMSLRSRLPSKARSWGLSRKLFNIFLRDALYTAYLQGPHGLDKAEEFYEVPLDSITAAQLRHVAARGQLPRWPGVKHLTPDVSDRYQAAAAAYAGAAGIARVHLDAYWWGCRRALEA